MSILSMMSLKSLTKSLCCSRLFSVTHLWIPDGSDGAGCGGCVLPLLAPSSRRSPLGGIWDLPAEPGLLCVTGGCSLPGVQQLICQPGHLRLPVGEL